MKKKQILDNISERKKAEKELQKSEQRYRYFYHNAHVALFSMGVSDGRPRNVNQLFAELMGYQNRQECMEHYHAEQHYVDPEDRPRLLKLLRKFGHIKNFVTHALKRNGQTFWASISAFYNKEADLLEGAIIDISERIAAEQAMESYQHQLEKEVERRTAELVRAKMMAEEANKIKTEFLANISHELRTPLHHILNYSKFGLTRADRSEAEKTDYFKKINNSCMHMLNHVEELIDLSRLESRQVEYDMQPHPISYVFNNIRSDLSGHLAEKGLTLRVPRTEQRISFDFGKIRQVISHVINNAIKYAAANTEIKMAFEKSENEYVITIHNVGIEIPHNELETIFDPFVQSSRTKSGAGGRGLGLSICRRIMEDHKGRIWAEYTENGATFKIAFPR